MSVPPPQTAPPAPRGHVSEGFEWWAPFAALFVALVGALVLTTIVALATGSSEAGDLPPGVLLVGTFIQDALLVAAMVGFAKLTGARTTPRAFGIRRAHLPSSLALGFALLVAFLLFVAAWGQLQPDTKDDLAKDLGANDSTVALIAVAFLVAIVAPIVEELFFRGFLFSALGRVMHWVVAALVTGFVFGAIHLGGTPAIFLVPLAVLGTALCVLYRRTGSLIPGMGVHAANNAIALAVAMKWSVLGGLAAAVLAPAIVVTLALEAAD
jgi:membrane protease YdiL (CAAX protease family)